MDTAFSMMGSAIPLRGSEVPPFSSPSLANRHFARIKDSIERKHVALIPATAPRHTFICVDDVANFASAARRPLRHPCHQRPRALTFPDMVGLYGRILGATLKVQHAQARVSARPRAAHAPFPQARISWL
jgi:hypothetical protein